jgi:hypothetical protein
LGEIFKNVEEKKEVNVENVKDKGEKDRRKGELIVKKVT